MTTEEYKELSRLMLRLIELWEQFAAQGKSPPKAADLLAYAKAEETLANARRYDPDKLRKKLSVPDEYECIGDWLDALRKAAIAKAEAE